MVTDEMPRREYPNFEPLDFRNTSWGEYHIPNVPGCSLFSRHEKSQLLPRQNMRTTFDKLSQFDPTSQLDAVMSRRSFLKSATAATVLASATPQVLLAERRKPPTQRSPSWRWMAATKKLWVNVGAMMIQKKSARTSSQRLGVVVSNPLG